MNEQTIETQSQLILANNGFIIKTKTAVVFIQYDENENCLIINGGTDNDEPVQLSLQGDLIINDNKISVGKQLNLLTNKIQELETKINSLTLLLDEVYYAPGLPGYIKAEMEWDARNEATNSEIE